MMSTTAVSLDPVVSVVLRLAFGLLFSAAALHKARAPSAFRATLTEYELLPERFTAPACLALVLAEGAVGCALLLPSVPAVVHAAALFGCLVLLALYSTAVAVNLARGRRHIDCGCAGPAARQPLSEGLLARNLVLMTLATLALLPAENRALAAVDMITIAGSVAVLALVYASSNRLMATAPASQRLRRPRTRQLRGVT